jgi:hypothetical protein
MALVTALLVIGVACAIAAWFVIREAGRMAAEPPPPVFDPEEAYDWVVAHVPDVVAATLTPADVRRILDFQLEYFQRKGVTGNGSSAAKRAVGRRIDNRIGRMMWFMRGPHFGSHLNGGSLILYQNENPAAKVKDEDRWRVARFCW